MKAHVAQWSAECACSRIDRSLCPDATDSRTGSPGIAGLPTAMSWTGDGPSQRTCMAALPARHRGAAVSTWLRRLFGATSASAGNAPRPATAPVAPGSALDTVLGAWRPALDVDVLFCQWLLGADPHADRPGDDREQELLAPIEAAALSDRAGSMVPRVPAVIPQLLQGLRDPKRSTQSLSRQVTQDPVLVAAVLRVANSPPPELLQRAKSWSLLFGFFAMAHSL